MPGYVFGFVRRTLPAHFAAHFGQGLTRKPRLRHNKQDCLAANRLDLTPDMAESFYRKKGCRMKYNFKRIEPQWQKAWEENKVFQAVDFSPKPKWYGLVEFPYPSGAGMHVGHIKAY